MANSKVTQEELDKWDAILAARPRCPECGKLLEDQMHEWFCTDGREKPKD